MILPHGVGYAVVALDVVRIVVDGRVTELIIVEVDDESEDCVSLPTLREVTVLKEDESDEVEEVRRLLLEDSDSDVDLLLVVASNEREEEVVVSEELDLNVLSVLVERGGNGIGLHCQK